MQPSAVVLMISLGAIAVLLMLYVYIFIFEHKLFLILWFAGWLAVAVNYALDACLPGLMKQNHTILLLSLSSYFAANLFISWGTFLFLKIKRGIYPFLGVGIVWLLFFIIVASRIWPDIPMITSNYLAVFILSSWVGAAMIRSAKRYGKLAVFLGLLNFAWIVSAAASAMLQIPRTTPFIVSQAILLVNAIGLVQLFFKGQKEEIERGVSHIAYLTYHDELTGVYNKPYFDKRMQEMDGDGGCLPVSILVGDMNGLKFVNDVFGHQAGDQWLKRIASLIQQSCRPNDIIARWGGDEFAIIFPNTDRETALDIGKRIKAACKSDRETDILLSISLGIATKTNVNAALPGVLKEAEEQMYEMKLVEGKKAKWAIARNLVKLLEKRNYESKEHIERLESLAEGFAHSVHFTKENIGNLKQAANLHDIGKIGIPEEVVLKNSRLEESEWSVMKKHVEIGYRIAHASGEFAHLADIILYHHEWWNGQGYPQGLKEEEIPLLSRIISILDAYDVMTHEQPYKSARTVDEALRELELKAGSQFDPELVPLFIGMISRAASINPVQGAVINE